MGLFTSKKRDKELDELNSNLNNSMNKVQSSLKRFSDWISYLNTKDEHQDYKLYELETELVRQGVSRDKIRAILQAKYQYHYLVEKVKDIDAVKQENIAFLLVHLPSSDYLALQSEHLHHTVLCAESQLEFQPYNALQVPEVYRATSALWHRLGCKLPDHSDKA